MRRLRLLLIAGATAIGLLLVGLGAAAPYAMG